MREAIMSNRMVSAPEGKIEDADSIGLGHNREAGLVCVVIGQADGTGMRVVMRPDELAGFAAQITDFLDKLPAAKTAPPDVIIN
jgi:hypothetical protein